MTGESGSIICPSEGAVLKGYGAVEASTGSAAHQKCRVPQGGSRAAFARSPVVGSSPLVRRTLHTAGIHQFQFHVLCETHQAFQRRSRNSLISLEQASRSSDTKRCPAWVLMDLVRLPVAANRDLFWTPAKQSKVENAQRDNLSRFSGNHTPSPESPGSHASLDEWRLQRSCHRASNRTHGL